MFPLPRGEDALMVEVGVQRAAFKRPDPPTGAEVSWPGQGRWWDHGNHWTQEESSSTSGTDGQHWARQRRLRAWQPSKSISESGLQITHYLHWLWFNYYHFLWVPAKFGPKEYRSRVTGERKSEQTWGEGQKDSDICKVNEKLLVEIRPGLQGALGLWEMPICTRSFRLLNQLSLDSKERTV